MILEALLIDDEDGDDTDKACAIVNAFPLSARCTNNEARNKMAAATATTAAATAAAPAKRNANEFVNIFLIRHASK